MDNSRLKDVATLCRFYGGDPDFWYNLPADRLEVFAEQMVILEAQERLAYINDTACASGTLRKGAADSHRRTLQRIANRNRNRDNVNVQASQAMFVRAGFKLKGADHG